MAKRAKLLVEIPRERYRASSVDTRPPQIGDIVVLDQAFTGADGLPMVLVYYADVGSHEAYEAEVYESELE